jgi:hypothetical protein
MSDVELIEIEPGRWRVRKNANAHADLRSDLPMPYVISDIMEPTEQVDGKFYTSKSTFRRVGRSLGLTEVGTEKIKPKPKGVSTVEEKRQRRDAIAIAMAKHKAGQRPGQGS